MSITLKSIIFIISFSFIGFYLSGQTITSPNSDNAGNDFGDPYFIFCAQKNFPKQGSLTVESLLGNGSFIWEKYDTVSGNYIDVTNLYNVVSDTVTSTINGLDDGLYRAASVEGVIWESKAYYVLNNWIEVVFAEIPDSLSTCDEFKIIAEYEYAPLMILNEDGERYTVREEGFEILWTQNDVVVSTSISPTVYDLIASESPVPYELEISDEFGCKGLGSVDYDSKVPLADFTYDPVGGGEAVLEVTFSNLSVNFDSSMWHIYKANHFVGFEIEENEGGAVDSVDFILYDEAPMYEYEEVGIYPIKLVVAKINETGNCYDTLYGPSVTVEESILEIPNVFTPNGDGMNDVFVVKSTSLRSLNVKIYNRWGGQVHSWNYSNITSSDYTYEHSVWDGKIGNKLASPGVYYYVITAEPRDVYREDFPEEQKTLFNLKEQLRQRKGYPVKTTYTSYVHIFRDNE